MTKEGHIMDMPTVGHDQEIGRHGDEDGEQEKLENSDENVEDLVLGFF